MREQKPIVSVIVPVYNVKKYLGRCIDSILEQTYPNLEIILVDDGSTDGSGQICDQYHQAHSDVIQVIHQQNGGQSDARNAGIRSATGQYICFVDSDDYISPVMIHTLYEDIHTNQAQIARIDFQKFTGEYATAEEHTGSELEKWEPFTAIKKTFDDRYANYVVTGMYARSLFEHISFPAGYVMEDLGTLYLLYENALNITYRNQKLYYYFQREDSTLHRPNVKFFRDKFEMVLKRYQYLNNKYGEFEENIDLMILELLHSYPFICDDGALKDQAERELEFLWKNYRCRFSMTSKIRYYLFRFLRKAYCYFSRKRTLGRF